MVPAPSRVDSRAGFVVGASCPGCGGEVELSNDFFVTECRHCGSVLRLVMPQIPAAYYAPPKIQAAQARAALDRYLRENRLPLTRSSCDCEAMLYPYWKLDLIAVKVRTVVEEFTHGEVIHGSYQEETTTQSRRNVALSPFTVTVAAGSDDSAIPATIGLRADYLKLRPFHAGEDTDSFAVRPVVQDVTIAMERAQSSVKTLNAVGGSTNAGQHRTEMVGVRTSIVYLPFYAFSDTSSDSSTFVVDAVSGRVVSSGDRVANTEVTAGRSQPLGQIGLELHRCQTCGDDLSAKPSLIYFCRNCGRLTLLGDAAEAVVRCTAHTAEDLLVPFWKTSGWLVPAFKAGNAEAMYRLTLRASGAFPNLAFEGSLGPDSLLAPITITMQEARVAGAIAAFRKELDRNPRATLAMPTGEAAQGELLLVAFRPQDYFWVDTALGAISFERALLR